MSVGARHDLEHGQQVLGVAAHGTTADVLPLSARARRVLVLTGHDTCINIYFCYINVFFKPEMTTQNTFYQTLVNLNIQLCFCPMLPL